jgi:hypothetical protein
MSILRTGFVLLIAAGSLAAQDVLRGNWGAEFGRRVHLNMRSDFGSRGGYSNYGRTFDRSELRELIINGDHISFRLVRDAGTLIFEGRGNDERGDGWFTFTPSQSYRDQLAKMGFSGLTPANLFVFAMGDLSVADVRYLETATSDDLSSADLVRMVNHGVTPEFVKGLADAGFKGLDSEELTRTRDHGVTPEFIVELRKNGYDMSLQEYVTARDHGVSEDYIAEMRQAGFKTGFESLKRAKDHGVDADFAQEFSELGYRDLTLGELVRLKDHGVSASFARRMNRKFGEMLGSNELVRLKDRGQR